MTELPRAPRAIPLQSATNPGSPEKNAKSPSVEIEIDTRDIDDLPAPPSERDRSAIRGSIGWIGRMFWGALSALVALLFGIWVTAQIQQLLVAGGSISYLLIGLFGVVLLTGMVAIIREIWAIFRLRRIDRLRNRHDRLRAAATTTQAKGFAHDLESFYAGKPDLARARHDLSSQLAEVMDPPDYLRLTEQTLLRPLDLRATQAIEAAARRVSVVTAVSPRALIDVLFVIWQSTRLIGEISAIYGGRPGILGQWRLIRATLGHLAITGSIAVGETLVQQLVGQGLAARLSAKLGEGIVNGIMTARIGAAAVDVCRPMAFDHETPPALSAIMSGVVRFARASEQPPSGDADGKDPTP